MHQFGFLAFISSTFAVRQRHQKHHASDWTTTADRGHGPCTAHLSRGISAVIGGQDNLPVDMPLICTAETTGITLTAMAYGHTNALLEVYVDGHKRGEKSYPWWQVGQIKTTTVSIDTLSSGLHTVHLSGTKIDLRSVTLQGGGKGSCSFDEAPGWDRAQSMDTYSSRDALNRLFGSSRSWPEWQKKALYFVSESVGRSEDGRISSTVATEGLWKWMVMYSQNSSSQDAWGGNWQNLWTEAREWENQWPELSLEYLPNRSGETMTVYEPCNTLSNLNFEEVAVWASCKAYAFNRDERASIVTALNGLAAGSSFLHSCGCSIGNRTDTFTMDWLMLQAYQIMVKEAVAGAGDALTEEERNAVFGLVTAGTRPVDALDVARDFTALMSEEYDRDAWNDWVFQYEVPSYMTSIGGLIAFTLYTLKQNSAIPGILEPLFDELLDFLLAEFFKDDLAPVGEWLSNTYIPAAKKALEHVTFCRETYVGIDSIVGQFTAFTLTYVEALVYQGNTISLPPALRSILDAVDALGLNSDLISNMERTWELYNGQDCLGRADHSVWHHRAGHGFLHLFDMAESLVTRTKKDSSECR